MSSFAIARVCVIRLRRFFVIREAFDNVRFCNSAILRNPSSPLAKTTILGLARLGHLHRLARSSLALWHHFCLLGGGDLRCSRQGAHP